tara:strand:+ start:443 stop:832 length:390 start_codon:yes stop_codon:yes gene_type:complete
MYLFFKLATLVFLGVNLADGVLENDFDFDPWEHSPDLPNGFFTLLRIIVSLTGAYIAWTLFRVFGRATSLAVVYGAIAILYQPIILVEFEYRTWLWIDLFVFLFIALESYASFQIGKSILKSIGNERVD